MGYASYTVYRNGEEIEAGYDVEDGCNKDGCTAKIDRGLGNLCGETPGGDEHGCGHYFCGEHLFGGNPGQCEACRAAADKRKRKEFCDQLGAFLRTMDGVKSADAVADKPEVLVGLDNGDEFVVTVA